MKKLYYVRHGESELNVSGHWAGRLETALTENGRNQASEAGKALSKKGLKIDFIICSPLSRTYDTAVLIAKELEYPIEKIQKNDLFIERGFGDMEGQRWEEFMKERSLVDMDEVQGAETVDELGKRAQKALEYIESLTEDNVLIVSHGGFGRALIRAVNKLPHHLEHVEEHRQKYSIGNAEIIELI